MSKVISHYSLRNLSIEDLLSLSTSNDTTQEDFCDFVAVPNDRKEYVCLAKIRSNI